MVYTSKRIVWDRVKTKKATSPYSSILNICRLWCCVKSILICMVLCRYNYYYNLYSLNL